jgi:hypothetical protein
LHNLSEDEIDFTLFTIVVFEGVMCIRNGVVIRELNVVSPKDIVDSQIIQLLPHEREIDYLAVGGAFGSDARKFLRRAKEIGKKVIDVGQKAYAAIPDQTKKDIASAALGTLDLVSPRFSQAIKDYGPVALDLYHSLKGQGWSEDAIYQEFIGRGYVGGAKKKAAVGGKKLTQKELKRMLA